MKKPRVGTKNLQKLLVVNNHEFKLDSSFEGSAPTSLPDGDIALNISYKDRPKAEAEALMELELEKVYEFVNEIGLEDKIDVNGNNVKQKVIDGTRMYTPYVVVVGDLEWVDYNIK